MRIGTTCGLLVAGLAASVALGGDESETDPRLGAARTLDTLHLFQPPADLASWEARAAELRLRIRIAAGLEPEPIRTALNPRITRTIDRGDYTVENLAFESLPGFFVTANVYRPKGEPNAKRPGVLCPHGHWDNGRHFERSDADARREVERGAESTMEGARFPLQARCAQLARMGCVVLHYDMVGYADNTQIGHGEGFRDVEAQLYGLSAFGLQTWNSIRALDLLCSFPDVDTSRIGATGASGGGTQTFVLSAIDERVKVAFPAVMVSSRMQGGCVCENAPHLRVGTDNVEIAALFAPRPLGLTGANDWTLHIENEGLPELKRVYALHGAEENVAAWCYPQFDHNYNQVARERMYTWFDRHLGLGHGGEIHERPFEPIAPADLRVFTAESPRPDGAGVDDVRAYLNRTVEPWPFATTLEAQERADVAAQLRRRLAVLIDPPTFEASSIDLTEGEVTENDVYERRRWMLRDRRTGQTVAARMFLTTDASHAPTVFVSTANEGAVADGDSDFVLGFGQDVLVVECLAKLPHDGTRHADYSGYTTTYNRTLVAERVSDVLLVLAYVRQRWPMDDARVVGLGGGALPALLARALEAPSYPNTRMLLELADIERDVTSVDDEQFLPGIRRLGSTQSLLGLAAPSRMVLLSDHPLRPDVLECFHPSADPISPLSVHPEANLERARRHFLMNPVR